MQETAGASLSTATTREPTRSGPSARHLGLVGLAAVVSYVADQATKSWAAHALADGRPRHLIGSLLKLQLTYNPGAAFSMGTNSTLLITAIAVAVVVALLVTARKLRSAPWAIAFGLIIGGATGNLTDRFFRTPGGGRGHVVDFLQLPHWPIFNIADSAICCAAALIVVLTFRGIGLDGRPSDDSRTAGTDRSSADGTTAASSNTITTSARTEEDDA